jgi:hypothetical protein
MEWVRQMLRDFTGCPFFLACYPKPSQFIPMMNLLIIDGEEVVVTGGERSPSYDVKTVSVKHKSFTDMAQEHFDAVWRNSLKLNEKGVKEDLLTQLDNVLK